MEHHKISRLLNDLIVSKFVTRKYIKINLLNGQYSVNKNVRFKIPILRSDLCDYSDVYIVDKLTIDLSIAAAANQNDKAQKDVAWN